MTRALVVYESMYGNTATIARAIGDGLGSGLAGDVVEVGAAPTVIDADVGLVVVGGPTHAFGLSRPSTRRSAAQQAVVGITSKGTGVREWMDAVEFARSQPAAAAFDTKLAGPRWIRWLPSAGRSIDRRLRRRGVRMLTTPESFWVTAPTGPLVDGEVARARRWGERLVGAAGRSPAAG